MDYIIKAIRFSAEAHNGQTRKGGTTPYIVHPYEVAIRVSRYTQDEDIISAALLHDVIEDCSVTKEQLNEKFNANIAFLVDELSNKEKYLDDWKLKKELYCNTLLDISKSATIIVACDKMANMYAYGERYKIDPDFVLKTLKHTHEEWSWYYMLVFNKIKERIPKNLKAEYLKMFTMYFS